MKYLDKANSLRSFLQQNSGKKLKRKSYQGGGSSCPAGQTWSAELGRCASAYENSYVQGLKKDREDIMGLYKSGADKALIDSRTQAFKQKYKRESGEPVQIFCNKYDCKIPPEIPPSTTSSTVSIIPPPTVPPRTIPPPVEESEELEEEDGDETEEETSSTYRSKPKKTRNRTIRWRPLRRTARRRRPSRLCPSGDCFFDGFKKGGVRSSNSILKQAYINKLNKSK